MAPGLSGSSGLKSLQLLLIVVLLPTRIDGDLEPGSGTRSVTALPTAKTGPENQFIAITNIINHFYHSHKHYFPCISCKSEYGCLFSPCPQCRCIHSDRNSSERPTTPLVTFCSFQKEIFCIKVSVCRDTECWQSFGTFIACKLFSSQNSDRFQISLRSSKFLSQTSPALRSTPTLKVK